MFDDSINYKGLSIVPLSGGECFITHPDRFIRQCYIDIMIHRYKSIQAAKVAITRFDKGQVRKT